MGKGDDGMMVAAGADVDGSESPRFYQDFLLGESCSSTEKEEEKVRGGFDCYLLIVDGYCILMSSLLIF